MKRRPQVLALLGVASLVCVGVFVVFVGVVHIAEALGFRPAQTWDHKAIADVAAAGRIAEGSSGFSADNRRLYIAGSHHLANKHERLGRFTIGQVIDAERARETSVAGLRQAIAQHAAELRQRNADAAAARDKAASDQAIIADEKSGLRSVFEIVRGSNPNVNAAFKDWSVNEDGTLQITVDADYWDQLSRQDKDRVGRILAFSWKKIYGHVNHEPDPSVYVQFIDLAGNVADQYY